MKRFTMLALSVVALSCSDSPVEPSPPPPDDSLPPEPQVMSVEVSPDSARIFTDETVVFVLEVRTENGASEEVMRETTCGTISRNDVFTPPSFSATCTVRWTSILDSTKFAEAMVNVMEREEPIQVAFWRMAAETSTNCIGARCENIWLQEFFLEADSVGEIRQLTPQHEGESFQDVNPDWFPDGEKIAFVRGKACVGQSGEGCTLRIHTVNVDGTSFTDVTKGVVTALYPSVSPDGTKIAFTYYYDSHTTGEGSGGGIAIIGANGEDLTHLTRWENLNCAEPGPDWSPDGTKLAFTSSCRDDNLEVYVMGADGTNLVNLTNHPARDGGPAFSPDGTRIAFISNRDGAWDVYVMNADGSEPQRITEVGEAGDVSWAPDGTKLLFAYPANSNGDIYMVNADGSGGPVNISRTPNTPERSPVWRPTP